jgi:hypothetical protein
MAARKGLLDGAYTSRVGDATLQLVNLAWRISTIVIAQFLEDEV